MVNTCAPRTQQQDASSSPDCFRSGLVSVCGTVTARHWVPRVVQDIFRTAPADVLTKELPDIMKVVTKVGEDAHLKPDLLENIPNIAGQAIENSERVAALKDVVGDYLIPLVVRNLGCSEAGVDKKAQTALILMIERGFVTKFQAEIKICPNILALTKMDSQYVDINTGAIMLMSNLAHYLGADITERIFLPRFVELCSSHLFYARKVSASHFGHYCAVIGKNAFEKKLLPCYLALCEDEIWGVRKACAEVIMYLSSVCPADLRKTLLASAFIKLLRDDCRWVKTSAFQTLGAFISTFADPPLTGIRYNTVGELVFTNQYGFEFHPGGSDTALFAGSVFKEDVFSVSLGDVLDTESDFIKKDEENKSSEVTDLDDSDHSDIADTSEHNYAKKVDDKENYDENNKNAANVDPEKTDENSVKQIETKVINKTEAESLTEIVNVPLKSDATGKEVNSQIKAENLEHDIDRIADIPVVDIPIKAKHEDDLLSYNEYNYWYISPPEVDLESIMDLETSVQEDTLNESSFEDIVTNHLEEMYATISLDDSSDSVQLNESIQLSGDNKGDNLDNKDSNVGNCVNNSTVEEVEVEPPQKIVPQELIDSFVQMAHSESTIENNLPYHCAYSLPAVILTLGKDNWPLLQDTMNILAGHMSYKIRRTVASSLHEIALILGPEIASEHLSPLFDGFLKDLDEVRIGILNHLYHFMQLMNEEKRALFLPKLGEFLRADNVCNWRFQEKLAEQLTECVKLFRPADIVKHIGLYAQALMYCNVAAVRQSAMLLVAEIVAEVSEDHVLASSYLTVIAERFAHSKKWKPRQTFAILCIELLKQKAMEEEQFASVMLPHLLDLSWDPVANVRLVVAVCIVDHLITNSYFTDPENEQIESLGNVLRRLQSDKDRDVRMSAETDIMF